MTNPGVKLTVRPMSTLSEMCGFPYHEGHYGQRIIDRDFVSVLLNFVSVVLHVSCNPVSNLYFLVITAGHNPYRIKKTQKTYDI